ncbi:MAG: glycosyltransferase family 8 protein [Ruminococcaceae bacterium]|nr:glycosyltransferase family 8 protein [Oscillospiraceae bacterium]
MKKEIPVFFSIDDSYAPFLAVALNSAIKNSSDENNYRAIVLYQELSEENIENLSSLATENFTIEFVPMNSGLEKITDRMSNRLRCDYFTLTIYFRLFIPAMFPQYDKGIYIDSDVVLKGDLAELFNIDIGDNYIGACADLSVVDVEPLARYMEEAVGVDRHHYINSGVLLMNLKKLREAQLDRHFLELLDTYHFDCIAPDQDYLNAICLGKIHYLSECWDAMPNEKNPPLSDAKLIHYNLFSKPWCYDGIQYGEYFWEYASDSGYMDEIKAYKENYSQEQKDSDEKCLGLLVERGAQIAASDITFRKMHESGVKIRL